VKQKIRVKKKTKLYNPFKKAYSYVGCYFGGTTGNLNSLFVETGLTSTQCNNAASSYSMWCYYLSPTYVVYTYTTGSYWNQGMTIQKCLVICNSYGFLYAGLGL